MYVGELWLDYETQDSEEHLHAKIVSCVISNDEIRFDFLGIDEGEKFSGDCKLQRVEGCYAGVGSFKYLGGELVSSSVKLTAEDNGREIRLSGTWHDEQDAEVYCFEAELSLRPQAAATLNRG
jgi:hypothetical protein